MEPLPFGTPLISHSLSETESLAARLYEMIAPTAVVALYGPLGAGKTAFVRGLALAAGVSRDDVSSPSFTLINEYPGGKTPIYHFDLYRLKSPAEFYAIGGDEYLARDGIMIIEWAENGGGFIPRNRFEVHFEIKGESERQITLRQSQR
jgi:tRNA threonylcarbamoyladenosine biosynthesis protein TsaE